MSTTISLPAGVRSSRRALILAAASALVAVAAIIATLAVTMTGGSDSPVGHASPNSPPAVPDRATLYQHSIDRGGYSPPSAADSFHHFR